MTMKFALKAGCAALAFAGMASAHAGLFYLDIGHDYATPRGDVTADMACPTCTSVKDQVVFQYRSTTVITDNNATLGVNVGNTTLTTAGTSLPLPEGASTLNNVTGFTPNEGFSSDSNNSYGGNRWQIYFGVTGLTGLVSSMTPAIVDGIPVSLPEITYNSGGILNMYVSDSFTGNSFLNFMNINITGGSSGNGGTILNGKVDFTGIEGNPFRNLFHSAEYDCGSGNGFFDLWNTCGANPPGDLSIAFLGDFNTDISKLANPVVGFDGTNYTYTIANARHDGSATFDVPEPGSLALLGLALAGLGMTQRRRKQV